MPAAALLTLALLLVSLWLTVEPFVPTDTVCATALPAANAASETPTITTILRTIDSSLNSGQFSAAS